jgi:enamine deaminase RidA (YjgF/YER057c/UK114 family)
VDGPVNQIINPPQLPRPSGFAHAVVAGDTVYLAGQIGDGDTLVEQFDAALANLLTALRAAGGDVRDLVSVHVFVTDVSAYRSCLSDLGALWRKHCGRYYPAMALLGVSELFEPAAMVELSGIAVRSS